MLYYLSLIGLLIKKINPMTIFNHGMIIIVPEVTKTKTKIKYSETIQNKAK
jgi:hypothetical protein